MHRKIHVHGLARAEIRRAARWYGEQATGLNDDFVEAVNESISQIERVGASLAFVYRDLKRMVVRRFPYGVYFRVRSERIEVVAVVHNRQSLGRLDGR